MNYAGVPAIISLMLFRDVRYIDIYTYEERNKSNI